MKLAPFQEAGRSFLAARKSALLADEMRLGKSAQCIRAADTLGARKILIICPASVKITWEREFDKWSDKKRSCHIVSGTKAKLSKLADVTIINYDLIWREEIYKQLMEMEFGVAVCDEAHYLAGRDSKRTKATLKEPAILSRSIYTWFTTGTPILSRPKELYPVLAAKAPHVIAPYKSYKAFTRHFCGGYWDGFQWIDKGATNIAELNNRLHNSGFMLRRRRVQVRDEMPVTYQMIPIQGDKKTQNLVAKEFNWAREDAKYQNLQLDDEIATVRRELALTKVRDAIRHINYLLTMEKKLVVFGYHREVLRAIQNVIPDSVLLMGGMSAGNKQYAIDEFNTSPKCRVFFGQITAAGVGIDLSVAKLILFVETSWIPGEIEQAADRCSGFNQTDDVSAQFLVIQDSLEEHMLRTVIDKKNKIESIVEKRSIFL